ncbi:uncharacterized protein YdeI (YjbR/CyaY-like superfamily) [Antricoccus suffuscus]|uniref:Uncharacterized protein YdeI (YjbR/CyaY-like superfamily) n=1 Tax=Antricoccus suffuscus TaxID=1629062 RepID=A0A2T1A2I7_9ACTN|nr:YdeI/OmpD-associated family protein [Antricoccus suffuscus]PRZ42815.1 uncharacterized protein YdeI (YjbR/CyaY-like superfamily) [Antricoccus suffuscus]
MARSLHARSPSKANRMIGTPGGSDERPALFFSGPDEFRSWLAKNHDTAPDLWMGLNKKHVTNRGLTWEQAVLEALCFGWIDSQVQRIDEDAIRQRWTPRRPGSVWSRINVAAVAALSEAGRMMPAGLAAFERRKPDREAIYSYEQASVTLRPDLLEQLNANVIATAFFEAATPSYRKLCINWVMSAKQEATRQKRIAQLIDDSTNGRLIPSQRYGKEPAWVRRVRDELGIRSTNVPPHSD